MSAFFTLISVLVLLIILVFFKAWCLDLIYTSIIPLFEVFSITLPELTYGMFVLIELVLLFFISVFPRKANLPEKSTGEIIKSIIPKLITTLIFAACAVLTSSIVFG